MEEETIQVKTKYDDYLKEMPSEVQDFMWSDLYDIIITAIQQTLSLTDKQTILIKNAGYELLMQYKNMEEVAHELDRAGIDSEVVAKILYLIDTEILTRAENITEFFTENTEDENITSTNTTSSLPAPTPADMLARLSQNMTHATVFAPTKRTEDPKVSAPVAPTPTQTQTIDPYRELPKI
jgi:hypothetical protein